MGIFEGVMGKGFRRRQRLWRTGRR